jgi:hypothetical protein
VESAELLNNSRTVIFSQGTSDIRNLVALQESTDRVLRSLENIKELTTELEESRSQLTDGFVEGMYE